MMMDDDGKDDNGKDNNSKDDDGNDNDSKGNNKNNSLLYHKHTYCSKLFYNNNNNGIISILIAVNYFTVLACGGFISSL